MKPLKRKPNWRPLLEAAMDRYHGRAFEWGKVDCVTLQADAVRAMTGRDLMKGFRGKYASPKESLKLLRSVGYRSMAEYLAAHFEKGEQALAIAGDLALVPSDDDGFDGFAGGVVLGAQIAVMTSTGFGVVSLIGTKNDRRVIFKVPV